MERQFVATVHLISNGKVLLVFHRKHQKWLPPGGHMEPNETPPEAARREAREETGLEIAFIPQENAWMDYPNAKSFERPYFCLIEEIPPYGDQPAHQHIDFIYVATPIGGQEAFNPSEVENMRWFSLEEVEELKVDEQIFGDTKEVIRKLLSTMNVDSPFSPSIQSEISVIQNSR